MDANRARALVAAERQRIEAELAQLAGDLRAQTELGRQQEGEEDSGSEMVTEMVDQGLEANLHARLDAVERAEARIEAGTYGRSTESGLPIPDERLEAQPLAERTVEEQRRFEAAR